MRRSSGIIKFSAGMILAACFAGCAAGKTVALLPGKTVALVQDGQPAATIVIRDNAGRHIKGAAEALQGYLEKVSGALLPIATDIQPVTGTRILIGASRATEGIAENLSEASLGYDGCVARTLNDDLVFLGPRDAGAANGVYWFLEWKLGVHRFGLRDDALVAPHRKTVRVEPFRYAHKPSFAWRQSWISSRLRSFTDRELANDLKVKELNRAGGIELSGAHSLAYLVPANDFFKVHPEYFALVGGSRTTSGQLCLSNPQVLSIIVDELKSKPRDRAEFVAISPNDGPDWCECEPCRQMAPHPAARIMLFCNRVIEKVQSTHPRLGACFLAYDGAHTMKPPLGLKAHPRVAPLIAPLSFLPVQSISSPAWPEAAAMRRVYEGWRRIADNVTTYPYMHGGPLSGLLPLPVPAVIADDVRYYHKIGLIGVQREHVGGGGARGFGWAMSYWIEWQLLWDADLDVDELRDVFWNGYYGRAAKPMARIYRRVESAVIKSLVDGESRSRATSDRRNAMLASTGADNLHDLRKALALADTPATKKHVEIDQLLLTALDHYVRGLSGQQLWQRSRNQQYRLAARKKFDLAAKVLEPMVEDAPHVQFALTRLNENRARLEGLFPDKWMVVGPFDSLDRKGFDREYGPEREIALDKKYQGKNGSHVGWQQVDSARDGRLELSKHYANEEYAVCYALTHVHSPDARTVKLLVGSDDGVKIWVNGEQVINSFALRGAAPDQDAVMIQLQEGWNRILAKVENKHLGWALYLRIPDPNGKLQFSAVPEPPR